MSIFVKLSVPILHHKVVTLLKVLTDVDLALHQVILLEVLRKELIIFHQGYFISTCYRINEKHLVRGLWKVEIVEDGEPDVAPLGPLVGEDEG